MLKAATGFGLTLALIYIVLKLIQRKKKYVLKDKVVVITGASSGLGEACAHCFYKAGATIVLCARREDELNRVKNDLLSTNVGNDKEPVVIPLDLSKQSTLPQIVDEIKSKVGEIDVLINNGGISSRGEANETSLDVDKQVMEVNYFGQVCLIKAILPSMIRRKSGHIVAISSVQGKIAIPSRSAYSASKHALQAFCDSLRAEVHESNVRVTVVNPGYIQTSLSLNALTKDGSKYGVTDNTTASGMMPEFVAKRVQSCVEYGQNELILSQLSHRAAIFIRTVYPAIFFWIMQNRARKERQKNKNV